MGEIIGHTLRGWVFFHVRGVCRRVFGLPLVLAALVVKPWWVSEWYAARCPKVLPRTYAVDVSEVVIVCLGPASITAVSRCKGPRAQVLFRRCVTPEDKTVTLAVPAYDVQH